MNIVSALKYICEPYWAWNRLSDPFLEYDLWFVAEGEGRIELNGQRHRVKAGTAVLFHPDDYVYAVHKPQNPLTVYAVHFYNQDPSLPSRQLFQVADIRFVCALLERVLAAERAGNNAAAVVWLQSVLAELENQETIMPLSANRLENKIQRLAAEIHANPGRRWRIGALANRCGISADHFSRVFRRLFNETPRHFISRLRIMKAVQLLSTTALTVREIAERLGYCDVYLFSRLFKQAKGQAPGQYRNHLQL